MKTFGFVTLFLVYFVFLVRTWIGNGYAHLTYHATGKEGRRESLFLIFFVSLFSQIDATFGFIEKRCFD